MVKRSLFLVVVFLAGLFCFLNSQETSVNAVFVGINEWANIYVSSSLVNIKNLFKEAAERNFNAVVFVAKEKNFVVYPSSYLPFYRIKNNTISELDYLAYAINEAKEKNLKILVWFDTLQISTQSSYNESWLCKTDEGKTLDFLSCSNLEVQQFLVDCVKELAKNYDIDGIIFDNLYYPSKNTTYDEVSQLRFYTRGNPKLLEYEDFLREQLNKLVADLYASVKIVKPKVLVGVSVFKDYKNTQTLKGAYYENYQDFKLWLDKNYCDFIVIKTTENKVVDNLFKIISKYKAVRLIDTKNKTLGKIFKATNLKQLLTPQENINFVLTGKVVDEKNLPVADAWLEAETKDEEKEVYSTYSSCDGSFNFVFSSSKSLVLTVKYPYCEEQKIENIIVDKIVDVGNIVINGAYEQKDKLFFSVISPKNFLKTTKDTLHILARTHPSYTVSVALQKNQSEVLKVFKTGIFVIDNYKLQVGTNTLQLILANNLKKSTYTFFIEYIKEQETVPTFKEEFQAEFKLIQPQQKECLLFSMDVFEIKLKAPPGKKIFASFLSNGEKILLDEIEDGIYHKKYLVPDNFFSEKTRLVFEYEEVAKKFLFKKKFKKVYETDCFVEVWNSAYPLVAEVVINNIPLNYGLHYVRLGGPYITELPKGTKLVVIGQQDDYYKVKLTKNLSGWVENKNVKLFKTKTNTLPKNYFSTVSVDITNNYEQIVLPLIEKVPYSLNSVVIDNKHYVYLDIFYTHFATTWLTQKLNTKVIENVRFEQLEDDCLRMSVALKQNWGFWADYRGKNLVLYIKKPKNIDSKNLLKGLKIAIEPGHGSDQNTGAISLSGVKEKSINLKFSELLKNVLEKEAAQVVFLREGDTNPNLSQRLQTAYDNNVDIILSIHCNAADTSKGYLSSAQGPSVYYKHESYKKLAESIHKKLTSLWKKDFGLVGNFNYQIIRQSRIPAVLIELGFLTHPEDEENLLDKNFNYKQAQAIVEGLKEFFASLK